MIAEYLRLHGPPVLAITLFAFLAALKSLSDQYLDRILATLPVLLTGALIWIAAVTSYFILQFCFSGRVCDRLAMLVAVGFGPGNHYSNASLVKLL